MEEVVRQYLGSGVGGEARFEAGGLDTAPGNEIVRLLEE